MEMTFDFGHSTERPKTLAEVQALLASGQPITAGPALMGRVHLQGDGPALSFYDDLEMLVLNLCVHAPKALAARGQAELRMASWDKQYLLLQQGSRIVVAEHDEELGDIELGSYPAQALLDALRAGGRAFAAFLDQLVAVEPQWTALKQMLDRELG